MKFPDLINRLSVVLLGSFLVLGACSNPKKQAVKQVESKGYGLTVKDMLVAASAGDVRTLEAFQTAGMNMDEADGEGYTALIMASGSGQTAAVERLLGMGADPKSVAKNGRNALIFAAERGYVDVARMLLSRGADPSIRDKEGWSALTLSAYKGHSDVVSLLSATASPDELDSALLLASFSGYPEVLNVLLGQGANINVRSPQSQTPLMIASAAGKMDAVRVLLQNLANPYAVDLENLTAVNLAQAAGHNDIVKLISNPDSWGSSEQGKNAAGEMANARAALHGNGIEETLLEGKPLAGEPLRGNLVQSKSPAPSPVVEKASPQSTPAAATVASAEKTEKAAAKSVDSKPVTSDSKSQAVDSLASTTSGAGSETIPLSAKTPEGGPASAQTTGKASEKTPIQQMVTIASRGEGTSLTPRSVDVKRVQQARQVREESKSKPLVALNGSTIHSRTPAVAPVQGMVLAAYHEEALPILVDGVEGEKATVRRLDRNESDTVVAAGDMIPGTPYKVREVSRRFVSSKEGKGQMVDVSRVEVENTRNGATHYLVKDTAGQTADTYAILTAPNSKYRYVVKAGDVFQTSQPDSSEKSFQVLDVRANAVVIKDLSNEEVVTVARDGVANP